jgi:GNAT superfamily N-acetyltransferase
MDFPDLLIREVTPADAMVVAVLSAELGYPASYLSMQQRIESLLRQPDHVVYVACLFGSVVGWVHVSVVHHLAADPRAEIGGLVVSADVRSRGVGACLVARAEQWAAERGVNTMTVRSRVTREDAHRFYLREGYERTKTSAVFSKTLDTTQKRAAGSL